MSKKIIALIIILSGVPFVIFIALSKPQHEEVKQEAVQLQEETQPDMHVRDSPQCVLCLQVPEGESRTQCLTDFACSLEPLQ